MDSSSSSDGTDEEFLRFLEYERRPYTVKPRPDYFANLDDVDFLARFRLSRNSALFVLTLIEDQLETATDRNHSITPMTKLLLTLRFYGLGSMLLTVGDFCGVSKSSACKIVRQVSAAIAALAPRFIRMPSGVEEIREAQQDFYKRARMPRVIGAVDCTHVKIQSPGGDHAENFRNRKGYFSLNVQTISSANLKILDIVARWPGATHDQTIFSKSRIRHRLMTQEFGDSLIVADSGYANTMYLITPLPCVNNPAEALYNESQIRTRNPVERQYGVWKRRFPVLALDLRLRLDTAMLVIIATAVLHNLALDEDDLPPQDPDVENHIDEGLADGLAEQFNLDDDDGDYTTFARDRLIRDHFANMI